MPKLLPKIREENLMPGRAGGIPTSPHIIDPLVRAMEGFGETASKIGGFVEERIKKINEAAEAERILNTHFSIKDDFMRVSQGFRERRDYEKFDEDAKNEEERIRTQYGEGLKTNKEKMAFAQSFGSMASNFRETIFNKKAQIITENSLGAFQRTYDESVDLYNSSESPDMKEAVRTNLRVAAAVLVDRGIMKPDDFETMMGKFDSTAEEAQIRDIGITKPKLAYELLMDKTKLKNIDSIKRSQLAEHYDIRSQQQDRVSEKQNKLNHDKDELDIGNFYMDGKFDEAFSKARRSQYLSGDEKRHWSEAIRHRVKEGESKEDNLIEYSQLLKKAISPEITEENRSKVNADIIVAHLKPETKKSLINYLYAKRKDENINLTQALHRLEEYRKSFFFVTSEKEGVVTSKESVENDQIHYAIQQELLRRVENEENPEDPFVVINDVMKRYTEKKARGFWDKVFDFVSPSAPPPMEKQEKPKIPPSGEKEGRYEVNGAIWNWTKTKGWYK